MSTVLVVTLTPNPEDRSEVLTILKEAIARVHAEDHGCELYSLHEEGTDFVLVEKWVDEAALDAHRAGSATRAMASRLKGRLGAPPAVRLMRPVAAGDAQLGTI